MCVWKNKELTRWRRQLVGLDFEERDMVDSGQGHERRAEMKAG